MINHRIYIISGVFRTQNALRSHWTTLRCAPLKASFAKSATPDANIIMNHVRNMIASRQLEDSADDDFNGFY
jgi:hypothetical protein